MTYRFKRNFVYLSLGYFIGGCLVLILSGCSLPDRLPEPYEKRTAQADPFQSDWDRQRQVNADWWNCTRMHRVDEC
jgi:hypothetical protein